jgi:hypothetical protein
VSHGIRDEDRSIGQSLCGLHIRELKITFEMAAAARARARARVCVCVCVCEREVSLTIRQPLRPCARYVSRRYCALHAVLSRVYSACPPPSRTAPHRTRRMPRMQYRDLVHRSTRTTSFPEES